MLLSAFVTSAKKLFFVLGMTHIDSWQFLEVLPIFFRNTRLQLKLLISIESSDIFHWKPAKKKQKKKQKNKVSVVLKEYFDQIRSNFFF